MNKIEDHLFKLNYQSLEMPKNKEKGFKRNVERLRNKKVIKKDFRVSSRSTVALKA